MNVNGNGVATTAGKQLLQLIPVNVSVVLTTVVCAVGLYYKFDARISALEKVSASTEIGDRLKALEAKANDNTLKITRIDTNVLWLMSKGKEPAK